jgi:putative Mn2+ efflux pump MntP
LVGKSAASYVEVWDHWVAFFLLLPLGLHMVYEGFRPGGEEVDKPSRQSFFKVSLTALGTSIDAMAVPGLY